MDHDPANEFHAPWMQHTNEGGVVIAELAISRRYIFSLAWSCAVLLQGAYAPPYNPGTNLEHVFLVVANMFAFYICALFIGSLVAMLEDLYSTRRQLKADQSLLANFMLRRNIPSVLQARALNDLAMNHESMVEHGAYEQVLDKLAPSVRQEIRQELYYTVVQRHLFFEEMSNDALRQLCGQ